jgi:hypothetical protein
LRLFFAGFDFPIRLRLFLLGSRGFLWVRIMGSQNVLGSGYGSNITVSSSRRKVINYNRKPEKHMHILSSAERQ